MAETTEKWRTWDGDGGYGETLYKRAVGDLPEMESSKAAARRIQALWTPGETILDVGCGAGHYLRSLRRELGPDVAYTGADATRNYVELARKAFADDAKATFEQADIFNLPFADGSYDIVMCNNVLLHLPSIAKPLTELVRVARRALVIRMLCGDRTFLIRDVRPGNPEIDANGEPTSFNHFNIYSRAYVSSVLEALPGVSAVRIEDDQDFDAAAVNCSRQENDNRFNSTRMVGNTQVNGCILQPWAFVYVTKTVST